MVDILRIKDNLSEIESIESVKIFGQNFEGSPYFTIAIPTYKRSSLLKETLESALNQEYKNYNIIVCDNNPERNDETEIMMRHYQDNPMISYYKHTQNIGMYGNWNKCVLLSDSQRIILLHDDDIIYSDALITFQECLSHIEKEWSLIKPVLDCFSEDPIIKKGNSKIHVMYKLHLINFIKTCAVGAPTCILLNKGKIIEVGGFGNNRFPCIDYEMAIKLAYYGYAYTYVSNSLGGYRIAANESLSEDTMDKFFLERSIISMQLMKHLRIPRFIRAKLDRIFEYMSYLSTTAYYNMPQYCLKRKNEAPSRFLDKVLMKIYTQISRFVLRINKITYICS